MTWGATALAGLAFNVPCAAAAPQNFTANPGEAVAAQLSNLSSGRPAQLISEYIRPAGKLRGVAVMLPGGGWHQPGPGSVRDTYMQKRAHEIRERAHFGTPITDYGAGEQGFVDAAAAVKRAKRLAHGGKVCIIGYSAGGHIALIIAGETDVDCVETEGAPTDPRELTG